MSKKEMKDLIKRAEAIGWECLGITGGNHQRVRWPATGEVFTLGTTPSSPSAIRNAEADLARISGPLGPTGGERTDEGAAHCGPPPSRGAHGR